MAGHRIETELATRLGYARPCSIPDSGSPARRAAQWFNRPRSSFAFALAAVALALAAAVALALCTPWGIGLSPDSIRYIEAARSYADGNGFRRMTHFPPLYPAAIAGLSLLLGLDPPEAARWLQVLLLPLNALLVAWVTYRVLGGRASGWGWACLAALLMAFGPVTLGVHCTALSEPLFLALQLWSLLAFAAYVRHGRTTLLLLSAAAVAAAILTRYAGLALLPAMLLGVLWLRPGDAWRRRAGHAALFALIAAAPIALWLLRNHWLGSSMANRTLAFHPVGTAHLEAALTTISLWFLPRGLTPALRWLLLGFLLGVAAEVGRRRYRAAGGAAALLGRLRAAPLVAVLLLCAAAYSLLLMCSISLVDYYTPLDSRILAPLYPVALVLALAAVHQLASDAAEPVSFRRRAVLGAVLVLVVVLQTLRGADVLATSYRDGVGFARRTWQESKLLARVRALPPETVIYSNAADLIGMLADRDAVGFPSRYDPASRHPNAAFVEQRQLMRQDLRARRGIVVYFRRINRAHYPSERYLREKLHLRTVYERPDGAIYKAGARPAG